VTKGAPLSIAHRRAAAGGEFILSQDGAQVGELGYEITGAQLTIRHTGVDPSMRGRGAARELLDAAVAFAREQGYKVVPRCSYARVVFARSPAEFADVLAG
jgi:predicted GNAT family acetyltransferase